MLPPVLEIYVIWHPEDAGGRDAANEFIKHFHGTAFSGLIGGAVEIYVRSAPWYDNGAAPRPLPFMQDLPYGIEEAELTAVVPVLGNSLADAVEAAASPWAQYLEECLEAKNARPDRIGIYPLHLDRDALTGRLGELLGHLQTIDSAGDNAGPDSRVGRRARELAQSVARLADPGMGRLTVFISHTKQARPDGALDHERVIEKVRDAIQGTRLQDFFDAQDLLPGEEWAEALHQQAASSALLAVRTDLYSGRSWCQREMVTAKLNGMPVVTLDALLDGEDRGSFLMDHVPRVPGHRVAGEVSEAAIFNALNQLVDECLKRALWKRQRDLADARGGYDVDWWAPHAPEPVTFARWLAEQSGGLAGAGPVRILHPDPPLGRDETAVLDEIAGLGGFPDRFEILTPRGLAGRGG